MLNYIFKNVRRDIYGIKKIRLEKLNIYSKILA